MSEANKLERHHQHYEMKPVKSFEYRGFKVMIAQGGPKFLYTKEVTRQDCPNGYYDVIFSIVQNEKALFEVPIYFDTLHDIDKGWSQSQRERARIECAQQAAMIHINDFIKESYAEGNHKR